MTRLLIKVRRKRRYKEGKVGHFWGEITMCEAGGFWKRKGCSSKKLSMGKVPLIGSERGDVRKDRGGTHRLLFIKAEGDLRLGGEHRSGGGGKWGYLMRGGVCSSGET